MGERASEKAAVAGFLAGGSMRHDWIFDVLSDVQDYALSNGLPDLARKSAEALAVARREVTLAHVEAGGDWPHQRRGRPH